ncbi:MAG: 2-C-methyl-D-erythritol 2,4-cyclodiphosphate synthase [Oscillospiraceae bacterium]|nr:2-C-methyl-D-erythritol 2,4-cyclodiphosphate synthase [Oscillospiraceae bacterium]
MNGVNKQFVTLCGMPVIEHSIRAFSKRADVNEIVAVTSAESIDDIKVIAEKYKTIKPITVVPGGATRQESVACGVDALKFESKLVAIHDGARPLIDDKSISRVFEKAYETGAATVGVAVKDTIKKAQDGVITQTPDRSKLYITQTPQVFCLSLYKEAMQKAKLQGKDYTDDCQLIENCAKKVSMVEGDYRNIKITTPEDIEIAKAFLGQKESFMRIGHGYDVHKFAPNRKLILAGVEINSELGLLGHSDADVLAHAIMDSILGAMGQGDIGKHFPDTDEQFKGADSMKLMAHVIKIADKLGYCVQNIDATVVAQAPKLAPYIEQMAQNIANVCMIDRSFVNVKATTEEGLGFTGRKEGISAHCVCIIKQK